MSRRGPVTISTHRQSRCPGDMNMTERRYFQWKSMMPEVEFMLYEPVRLLIAPRTHYTPDFLILRKIAGEAHLIEFHEVKGFWRDDARIKIKVAAEIYWWARFVAIAWNRSTERWIEEVIP